MVHSNEPVLKVYVFKLSVPSGRFARGTLISERSFLRSTTKPSLVIQPVSVCTSLKNAIETSFQQMENVNWKMNRQ